MFFIFMNIIELAGSTLQFLFLFHELKLVKESATMRVFVGYHKEWLILLFAEKWLFLISFIAFMCVSCSDPGYSKSIETNQFYHYLDKAIKEQRSLDYFCFFCKTLWSSSSLHCMTCKRCVEGFDHHCIFMNNCIGYRNYTSFIVFLFLSFCYAGVQIAQNAVAIYNINYICEYFTY